jgi:hypothetical protein
LPPYEAQSIDNYKNIQVKDGLVVAMHPIIDAQESERYFGTDLLSSHILAVLLLSENRAPSSSFILSKEHISLGAGLPEVQQARDKVRSEAAGEAVAWTGAVLISPLMMGIAMKLLSDATVINHNFKAREFQTKTLSPGQRAEGFLYFQLPEKKKLPGQWVIHIKAIEAINKGTKDFTFTFASGGY